MRDPSAAGGLERGVARPYLVLVVPRCQEGVIRRPGEKMRLLEYGNVHTGAESILLSRRIVTNVFN